MSLTLNMVGGGGGGGSVYAFIVVTYPSGSTCTCSNGTKTLTAIGTTGNYVFSIPSAGTWTVTSTDGTNTDSQTVTISSEGQSESVELMYSYYIVQNGLFANGQSFPNPLRSGHPATSTENYGGNGYLRMETDGQYASGNATNLIDVTKFSKLYYEMANGGATYVGVGVYNSYNFSQWNEMFDNAVAKATTSESTKQTGYIDLSSINGSVYIGGAMNGGGVYMNIWNLVLER